MQLGLHPQVPFAGNIRFPTAAAAVAAMGGLSFPLSIPRVFPFSFVPFEEEGLPWRSLHSFPNLQFPWQRMYTPFWPEVVDSEI